MSLLPPVPKAPAGQCLRSADGARPSGVRGDGAGDAAAVSGVAGMGTVKNGIPGRQPARLGRSEGNGHRPHPDLPAGTLPCEWKWGYDSWVEAEEVCLRMLLFEGLVTWAYRCLDCPRWHTSKHSGFPTGRNYFDWYRLTLRGHYAATE